MRKVVVLGTGMTVFGKFPDKSIEELGSTATYRAVKDANISPAEIQTAYVGNQTESRETGHSSCLGQNVLNQVGINKIPIMRVESACSSGSAAIREAWIAVGSGMYDIALALGVEKLTGRRAPLTRIGYTIEGIVGYQPAGWWAMRAKRYMAEYGATIEQLAEVSVKNHHNSCLDPYSQYNKEFTLDEVLQSDMTVEPLTLFQCCPISDGAAAVVLCTEQVARKYNIKPIFLAASVLTSGSFEQQSDMTVNELESRASAEAYKIAGVGQEDLSFAEVHDCFTIAEFLRCESLGFCNPGEYGRMLDEGKWSLGGSFPINPSGGLLGKGHPVGATGVAQVCEAVWQLRGEAGERQVPNAKAALTHCSGGQIHTDNASCGVQILTR